MLFSTMYKGMFRWGSESVKARLGVLLGVSEAFILGCETDEDVPCHIEV